VNQPASPPGPGSAPSAIALTASMDDYFRDIVDEAVRAHRLDASAAAQVYLVQLLSDFARPGEDLGSAMESSPTLLLHEAMAAPPSREKFTKLRSLGDGVLYHLGFFGDHVAGRGVQKSYVAQVGSSAYENAAAMLRVQAAASHGGPGDVLVELARKFERFVAVLAHVADRAMAQSALGAQGVVKVYERWLRTGSTALATGLAERGLMPTRGGSA
jgi:hypothetical protein